MLTGNTLIGQGLLGSRRGCEFVISRVCLGKHQNKPTRDQVSLTKLAKSRIAKLTPREREVLEQLVAGRPNKLIAYELNISPRTVEIHRAHLMKKMDARSLSDLVRMALAAGNFPDYS